LASIREVNVANPYPVSFPTLFRIIPWIGLWIQAFGNVFAYVGAFLMSSFCFCVTVAYSWLAVRPVKAILLFSVAAAFMILPSVYAAQHPQSPQ